MSRRGIQAFVVMTGVAMSVPVPAHGQVAMWVDELGDAVARRTDIGNNGTPAASSNIDLISVAIAGWQAFDAKDDPYTGLVVGPVEAHLFRLDVVVKGLVTPPGPLGFAGLDYDPVLFGANPLYGFIEFDLDGDADSGGELGGPATHRYLANVARFGRVPIGWQDRTAASACEYTDGFFAGAQYERSGADWTLAFCGCVPLEIEEENPVLPPFPDGKMGPGETMVVKGRMFTRAGGFEKASGCFSSAGGPIGLYEPDVEVRFAHNIATNTTTITLVWALDMEGAGLLEDNEPEAPNSDYGDQASVYEGLKEIADYAGPVTDPATIVLAENWWAYKDFPKEVFPLNPVQWRATAAIGTAYASPQDDGAVYVWTDTGFDEVPGDLTGDGDVNGLDAAYVMEVVELLDGSSICPGDGDGEVNGLVVLEDFSQQFHLADTDYDGQMFAFYCYPDCDLSGFLDIDDFICFQVYYAVFDPAADCDGSGKIDIDDFICFQTTFAFGCG